MSAKENPMRKIIAKCWEDEEFKKRLMAAPNDVLRAEGVRIPEGITVKVVEDTDTQVHLVLPCSRSKLFDADLDAVSGGWSGPLPINAWCKQDCAWRG